MITALLLTSECTKETNRRNNLAHSRDASSEEGVPWVIRCSGAALLLGDSLLVPGFREVVMTLFNENNPPLLTGEEDTRAFSHLTDPGVDLETAMIYHTWELDLDTHGIVLTHTDAIVCVSQWVRFLLCPPPKITVLQVRKEESWPVSPTLPVVLGPPVGYGGGGGGKAGGWPPCHVMHANLIRCHHPNGLAVAAHQESLNLHRFN